MKSPQALLVFILALFVALACAATQTSNSSLKRDPWGDIPYPFTRDLYYNPQQPLSGKDVYAVQHLLNRATPSPLLTVNSIYDKATSAAMLKWKVSVGLPNNDIFDIKETAYVFLDAFYYDKYKDNGVKAADLGLKFKVYIPVHKDRSIETIATLYDANNNVLHRYPARTRAHTVYGEETWPSFDNKGSGLIDLSGWGFTPSGLSLMDLNTPEPPSVFHMYGKWDVLRLVRGLDGNALVAAPTLRNGILQHTGDWYPHGWDESKPMPNSSGCIHVHPADQEKVVEILKAIGVVSNENPFGQLPYPFTPQGLLSVEVIADEDTRFDYKP